jgi:prepilin-type N-terminal cleavage/methylation domain-containing protein
MVKGHYMRAFTLLELLVVISVILLLLGFDLRGALITTRPFDQIVLSTSDAAGTFKDLKLSFIE